MAARTPDENQPRLLSFLEEQSTMSAAVQEIVANVWAERFGVDPHWTRSRRETFFGEESSRPAERADQRDGRGTGEGQRGGVGRPNTAGTRTT